MLKKIVFFNVSERDKFVIEFSKSIPYGSKVLDAGAGSCPYRVNFSHCEYLTQDFIQLDDEQLRYGNGYGKIDIISDITSIPLDDETFDVIICTEVFEHIPRPDLALREFSRLLKKGGKLLITAPLMSGLHQEPYHFYGGFTPYWYKYFFQYNLLFFRFLALMFRALPMLARQTSYRMRSSYFYIRCLYNRHSPNVLALQLNEPINRYNR